MRSRTVKKLLLSCLALLAAGCEPPVTSPGVNPPPVNPPRNTGPSLAFFVQPPSRVITGEVIPAFEVVVLDDDGNPDVSASQAISITLGANPGGGSLSGTSTAIPVRGVGTFGGLSIDRPGAGYTLTAAELGVTGRMSSPFDVVGEPVATVTVVGVGILDGSGEVSWFNYTGPVDAGAGDIFWLSAMVEDAAGDLLTDRTVNWTNSDPSKLDIGGSGKANLVDGGVVYQASICGLAPGSVTLSATSGQGTGTALVTVSGSSTPGYCWN
jgi:hypothetical protein